MSEANDFASFDEECTIKLYTVPLSVHGGAAAIMGSEFLEGILKFYTGIEGCAKKFVVEKRRRS